MQRRVLVTGAGTGPSNNLVRSLRAGDSSLRIVGCHHDRFALKKSNADRRCLLPDPGRASHADRLARLVETERVDLVVPTTDADVRRLADLRGTLSCRVFLPSTPLIELCQDKYAMTARLRARGVAVPETVVLTDLRRLDRQFARLAREGLAWCRIRTGSGSLGATPVRSAAHVRSWIRYWRELQGAAADAFTLSEYLPGRDWSCQSLWRDGTLVLVKTFENLSAFGPGAVSSVAELARTVYEPRVAALCTAAIRALDAHASGVFCFDVREDARGVPRLTDINAGRFSMSTNLYDLAGRHNMAVTYVHLALGEPVDLVEAYDAAEDYYMVRDLDTLPEVFHADQFFEDLEDARR